MSRPAAQRELCDLIGSAPDWAVSVLLWIAQRMLDPAGRVHRKDVSTAQELCETATDYAVARVDEMLRHGPGGAVSPSGITARRR